MKRLALITLCSALLAAPSLAREADVIADWNRTILSAAEDEDGFLTLKGVRTAAMAHIAMHDALAAIEGRYRPYLYEGRQPGAESLAAAVEAARVVAAHEFPGQAEAFLRLRDSRLPPAANDLARQDGFGVGQAAATAILTHREGDRYDAQAEYEWHPMGPGVYAEFNEHSGTPQGFVFGAGWAKARPFALQRADQFRSPAPPAIDSKAYTLAYNEVRDVGRFQSPSRTADQTHLALWWKDFAENSHNRLARDLVAQSDIDLASAVRLFALINIGIHDAYVSVFDNKFHYNFWRPYTAIRWADNDGNDDTAPDETWDNTHRHTYAFPSYPSAHGSACAAAMTALQDTFGDDREFTMRIPLVDIAGPFSGKMATWPPTRQFRSFSEAADECGLSRVYLGIHFRFDSVEGVKLGRQVGDYIVANYLQPVGR